MRNLTNRKYFKGSSDINKITCNVVTKAKMDHRKVTAASGESCVHHQQCIKLRMLGTYLHTKFLSYLGPLIHRSKFYTIYVVMFRQNTVKTRHEVNMHNNMFMSPN